MQRIPESEEVKRYRRQQERRERRRRKRDQRKKEELERLVEWHDRRSKKLRLLDTSWRTRLFIIRLVVMTIIVGLATVILVVLMVDILFHVFESVVHTDFQQGG